MPVLETLRKRVNRKDYTKWRRFRYINGGCQEEACALHRREPSIEAEMISKSE